MMTRLKRWAVTGVCMAAGALFLGSAARGAAEDLAAYGLEGLPIPKAAVRFVDGIRCGDPNDPHKVTDYEKPSRIETVLGRPARVAADAWQVFGYTLTVEHPEKPHMVVITWPDDVPRRVHFRVRSEKGGFMAVRSGLNSLYSAAYGVNSKAWARFWTPFFIPGGTSNQVQVLFADSRNSKGLAPNNQGPKQLAPWAVGEIMLYEVTDPAALLPEIKIARPVAPGEERYFGSTGIGDAESYLRDPANKAYVKQYLGYIGMNFMRFAGSAGTQGGPAYGTPQFENQLAMLDDMGVGTSFVFFKYFNAFLMDRLKTGTLPKELIDTMPKPIRQAIDDLGGWTKPDNLYEGGSYQARLMVMPLNWLDPDMGPWLKQMVRYYLGPAAKHKCISMVRFFGTGSNVRGKAGDDFDAGNLEKAVDAFGDAIRTCRNDLVVEMPELYMDIRARERLNLPVPYVFDYKTPFAIPNEKNPGEMQTVDRVGFYDAWPPHVKGAVGGLVGSLWRGFHFPTPGLAILDSPEALAAVRRFDDGWIAQFRIFEQNESESPKGIGWINDYYTWTGPAGRMNILHMMARGPRYVVINNGHEGTAWQEGNLRVLAAAWRAFPWGPTEDLSARLAPPGSTVHVLKCGGRLLALNLDAARREIALPSEGTDAVTGEAVRGALGLFPFEARTVVLAGP